jgi:hypothetical protein
MNKVDFKEAKINDLTDIIKLIFDDKAAKKREKMTDPILPCYIAAFNQITNDPNASLITVKQDDKIIGIAQLNFIANLTYQGGVRA